MPRVSPYFSWEKKEKMCNGECKKIKSLKEFRRSHNATEDERLSAFYNYQCIECANTKAREYQRNKKKC